MRGLFMASALALVSPLAAGAQAPAPSPAAVRLEAFRTFAGRFVGAWRCEIREWDGTGKVVWSDTQRRVFTLTMARHVLEERAILKTPDGRDYEGGLHVITFDPNRDRIVQHGFWLPTQAERLFVVDGRISGDGYDGAMTIRLETGGEETRPYRLRRAGPDRWTVHVDGKRADGSTYLKEELVYVREPAA